MLIKSLSAAAATAALTFAPMAAASADTLTFGAGEACSFPLQIDITGGPQVNKIFEGRVLFAGTGSDLVFTNLDTGATYTLAGNGAVQWIREEAEGSERHTLTGHNVVIYFPSDNPAGPSTTLVLGERSSLSTQREISLA